jgi:hypothetical protein
MDPIQMKLTKISGIFNLFCTNIIVLISCLIQPVSYVIEEFLVVFHITSQFVVPFEIRSEKYYIYIYTSPRSSSIGWNHA